jgi:hypothetical protein
MVFNKMFKGEVVFHKIPPTRDQRPITHKYQTGKCVHRSATYALANTRMKLTIWIRRFSASVLSQIIPRNRNRKPTAMQKTREKPVSIVISSDGEVGL